MKKIVSALVCCTILSSSFNFSEAAVNTVENVSEDDEVKNLLERYAEIDKKIEELKKAKAQQKKLQKKEAEQRKNEQPQKSVEKIKKSADVDSSVSSEKIEKKDSVIEVFDPVDVKFTKVPAPQPPQEEQIAVSTVPNYNNYTEPKKIFSFDWRGTPLPQSIYGIARVVGMGVVVNADIGGKVYTSLHDVTCEQALDYLGRAFDFNWMIEDGNIIITKEEMMKQSRTFKVEHASKEKLVEEFKSLGVEETNIYANPESGTISITGTPWELHEAERRLRLIDKPVNQCLLLAQLIEVSHGKDKDLGMTYSLPTYTHDEDTDFSGKLIHKLPFSVSVTANKEISNGKVIARPMVTMLNGETGKVQFGDSVPIMGTTTTNSATTVTVEYRDVGTNLSVTPVINKELNEITLNVEVEVSNITSWRTSGNTTAPQISTRKATTSTHLKSGESFVIGGLMSDRELKSLSGIPGLMNLPILGALFRAQTTSHSYSEVFVMITPYIISGDVTPQKIMAELKANDAKKAGEENGKSKSGSRSKRS